MLNTILGIIGRLLGGQVAGPAVGDAIGNAMAGQAGISGIVGLLLPLIINMLRKKSATP